MKVVIVLFGLMSIVFADTGYQYPVPTPSLAYGAPAHAHAHDPAPAPAPVPARASAPASPIAILRDDREYPEDGKYSFDFETENGIVRSESGSPSDSGENPTEQEGSFKFTFPTGEEFSLKFVADEDGFQPESSWIPVAPEFPHPIPQFVLDQIEKAAKEDAEAAAAEAAKATAPSAAYGAPPPRAAYGAPPPPVPRQIYSF